jgi:hypothetical protein
LYINFAMNDVVQRKDNILKEIYFSVSCGYSKHMLMNRQWEGNLGSILNSRVRH